MSTPDPDPPLEIERKYLLTGMPTLPSRALATRLEQGYLPAEGADAPGRLRRAVKPDGTIVCTHTLKRGRGLVREEIERRISVDEFEARWPETIGRRVIKTRHCVDEPGSPSLVWEVDDLHELGVVLAEVELPSADTETTPPAWLAGHVEREVTDDERYTNYELATRGLP